MRKLVQTLTTKANPLRVSIWLLARKQTAEFLRALIVQQPGEPYSNAKVQQSVAALMGTGEFSGVRVQISPDNGGLRLIFVLEPAYYLGLVEFPGAVPAFNYTRLLQVVSFPEGSPFFKSEMDNATGALQTFLRRSGYFLATVKPRAEIDREHKLVEPVFEVTLNRRAKIGTIDFEGLSEAEAEEERASLSSFWTHFKKGRLKDGTTFTAERIQEAIGRIRNTLGSSNRLVQEISLKSASYDPNKNRANLLFHVKLGPTFSVQLEGAHLFKRTLKKLIPIYQENSYDSDLLAEGRTNLANYFQSKGYFDVRVTSEVQQMPDRVAVVYQIQEGKKHKVGNVAFTGNQAIGDKALRAAVVVKKRKLLFSRGSYSQTLLRASVNKIVNMYQVMGFPDVKVATRVQDMEAQVNVTFEISEGTRATVRNFQITGGGGLEANKLPTHGLRVAVGKPYSPELEEEDRNDILAYYLDRGFLSAQLKSSATPVDGDKYRVDVAYQIQAGPETRIRDVVYLGNVKTKTSLIAHTTALSSEMPLSESKMLAAESDLYNLGIFDWTSVGPRQAQEVTAQLEDAEPPEEPASAGGGDPAAAARAANVNQATNSRPDRIRRRARTGRRRTKGQALRRTGKCSSKYTNRKETQSITAADSSSSAAAARRRGRDRGSRPGADSGGKQFHHQRTKIFQPHRLVCLHVEKSAGPRRDFHGFHPGLAPGQPRHIDLRDTAVLEHELEFAAEC